MPFKYNDIDPTIRRGIKTIIEYWQKLENCEIDINNDEEDWDVGVLQLIEDMSADRMDASCSVDNLSNRLFKRFGYSYRKAQIIKEKLTELAYSDELDHDYAIKILREFDSVSCCLADLEEYPMPLVQSLYAISTLEKHDDMTEELIKAIWYIMSIYRGCPRFDVYREYLRMEDYDYSEHDFLSPEEREERAEVQYEDNYIEGYDPDECDPEVYGCCVKVRFKNGRTYKYNCRYDDVSEDSIVHVSGKMSCQEGVVVERMEIWNTSDYMEEVTSIDEY